MYVYKLFTLCDTVVVAVFVVCRRPRCLWFSSSLPCGRRCRRRRQRRRLGRFSVLLGRWPGRLVALPSPLPQPPLPPPLIVYKALKHFDANALPTAWSTMGTIMAQRFLAFVIYYLSFDSICLLLTILLL